MTELSKPCVVIYHETDQGISYDRENYDLAELGDTIPVVGDLIVYPGVPRGEDRATPENHTLYEVTKRYFKPQASKNIGARIILIVKSRKGERAEIDLLYR